MMDQKFTETLGQWLNLSQAEKTARAAEGAELLLRLSRNRIEYQNLMRDPAARIEYIELRLQKYYNFRVQNLTHEQFVVKAKAAEAAVKRQLSRSQEHAGTQRYVGKRPDHDQLPQSARDAYEAIPALRKRMAEVHLRLRSVTDLSKSCLDSDAWPFVDELNRLDMQIRQLWQQYDSAVPQVSEDE